MSGQNPIGLMTYDTGKIISKRDTILPLMRRFVLYSCGPLKNYFFVEVVAVD